MILLGFHQGVFSPVQALAGHDAGAALVIDGEIVAAAEEERFSRTKHTASFPQGAIAYCLKAAGVELQQVDRFCFPWSPELDRQNMTRADVEMTTIVGRHSHRATAHARMFADFESQFGFVVPDDRRRRVPHHLCHAASSFYCSPFERAAFLVLDAYGEMVSISVGTGRDTRLEPMMQTLLPTSLGVFYSDYTRLLGFLGLEDEYKVMGLAAYGTPERFRHLFGAQWRQTELGVEQRTDATARAAVLELARHRRVGPEALEQVHRDLAAALQESLEHQILHLADRVRALTGEPYLCMAGGVALNSTANGKLARSGLFRDLFIQPAANDAGTPLGAALLEHYRSGERRRPAVFSPYLGPAFSDAQLDAACARFAAEISVARPDDLLAETVRRLRAQQIVAWFQGRMEYGPRALGNRSILADPHDLAIRERINQAVKHRETFRPFAPAVLLEHAAECFAMPPLTESPFMLLTVPARPERRGGFEAAVHQDGTSRVQTVSRDQNPRFHALLQRFHAETGVPVLLNTSFNVNGEPIVCTPEDAIESFLSTDLDVLVLGDLVVTRRPLSPAQLLDHRPCLQDGVHVRGGLVGGGAGAGARWKRATAGRRHVRCELDGAELAILLACDGTRTGTQLATHLASEAPGDLDGSARKVAAVLERLLRARLIRLG